MWHKIDKNVQCEKEEKYKKKKIRKQKENIKPKYLDSSAQESDCPSYFKKT